MLRRNRGHIRWWRAGDKFIKMVKFGFIASRWMLLGKAV